MKPNQIRMRHGLLLALAVGAAPALSVQNKSAQTSTQSDPQTIAQANFDDGKLPGGRWSWGAYGGGTLDVASDRAQNFNNSKGSVRARYPVPAGGIYALGSVKVADLKLREVYVEFRARMPAVKHGLKFLKIFGGHDGKGYANATIQPDYTGIDNGGFVFIGFGDGKALENDFGNVIFLNGAEPSWIGRSYGLATVNTPQKSFWPSSNWGADWHRFRVKVKFNSGDSAATETNDGEFYLEIDGTVYVDAKGLFNRHPSNLPIDRVTFMDWSQSGTQPFEVWYDDIVVSTGGFTGNAQVKTQ